MVSDNATKNLDFIVELTSRLYVPLAIFDAFLLAWCLVKSLFEKILSTVGKTESETTPLLVQRQFSETSNTHLAKLARISEAEKELYSKIVPKQEIFKALFELLFLIFFISLNESLQLQSIALSNFAESLFGDRILLSVLLLLLIYRMVLTCKRDYSSFLLVLRASSFTSYAFLFSSKVLQVTSLYLNYKIGSGEGIKTLKQLILAALLFTTALISLVNPLVLKSQNGITSCVSSEEKLSIFDYLTFSWLDSMIFKHVNVPLSLENISKLPLSDQSLFIINDFFKVNGHGHLAKLIKLFWKKLLLQCTWSFIGALITFVPALEMRNILNYIDDPENSTRRFASVFVVAMCISKIVAAVCETQAMHIGNRISMQLKTLLTTEVFNKVLNKSLLSSGNAADVSSSDGDVQNLLAVDISAVSQFSLSLHTLVQSFTMSLVALLLLYRLLSWSALIGVSTMVVLFPLNIKIAKMMKDYQSAALKYTDKKTNTINEVLGSIKNVKYLSWEIHFQKLILNLRRKEVSLLVKKLYCWTGIHFLFFVAPTLVTALTFSLSVFVQKEKISIPCAFTTLSLFAILRAPINQLATILGSFVQIRVSFHRIETFLNSSEAKNYGKLGQSYSNFKFANSSFIWNHEKSGFKLQNLNFSFKQNALNIITGPSGSGKTSLLLSILGELELVEGVLYVPNDTLHQTVYAYCSQTPWIVNTTLRDNILFFNSYHEDKYLKVISCCGLDRDICELEAGDQTIVGNNGMNLSGGQKQRVALARAIYSDSKYVILDDCLSAVDPGMVSWIFEKCLKGDLMNNRTCIMATHNNSLINHHTGFLIKMCNGKAVVEDKMYNPGKEPQAHPKKFSQKFEEPCKPCHSRSLNPEATNLREESKTTRSMNHTVYLWLIQYIGGTRIILFFTVMFFFVNAIDIFQNIWIKDWINAAEKENEYTRITEFYMGTFLLVGVLNACMVSIIMFCFLYRGLIAMSGVYQELLKSVLYAKMQFFDVTPVGRIINRFTKDFQILEQDQLVTLLLLIYSSTCFASIITLISIVTPKALIFSILLAIAYASVVLLYIPVFRDLKRYESITRSPLFEQLSEALSGFTTIRSYCKQEEFLSKFIFRIDQNNIPFLHLAVVQQWLCLRIEVLSSFVLGACGAFCVSNAKEIGAGLAGVCLNLAMPFSLNALWIATVSSNFEVNMISAERIKEYTEIHSELGEQTINLPHDWHSNGKIEFKNVFMRYAPNQSDVLKNVTFEVHPNSRVAIVGRTGSGKSTILNLLCRFIEPTKGQVKIGNVNIQNIKLDVLRKALTIVPQDPILFSGSIRSNIDPFMKHSDVELKTLVRKFNLVYTGFCEDYHEFINTYVEDRGKNLSQGQRQIICLMRAFLKRPNILILDEATASIDNNTEVAIQEALQEFSTDNITITIAHRMRTIIDYDEIVVLDSGIIKQIGHPYVLLKQKSGLFYEMCMESGELNFLESISKQAYMGTVCRGC
ncbi:LAFE_0E00166g1_1 [Lachancea fermentati]|uniref:LAFE_0E00166g1_1 n=1 Tax=Lachancea fermentati TaxID=4955 RepID=A0A1G4MC89_LACFM|nr:LAFE_0E00166g1_1 [Lachancea fermentati]